MVGEDDIQFSTRRQEDIRELIDVCEATDEPAVSESECCEALGGEFPEFLEIHQHSNKDIAARHERVKTLNAGTFWGFALHWDYWTIGLLAHGQVLSWGVQSE